ncbi:MAG: 1-(5-phosphoribosyl)-5-((5-phosphoribosylamino)methylideneamino)imidazole-4-carboxamide isomerase [Gammaproteobacteria bacterium]|nr:MAG: 1-(5-phosphoribosyl)-5-((5-phosphoribosylamino)methylideneamino)imidazole-4-carboxamide isomerase [Gammaproteobacteria bacterium]RLA53457.1 MAG: 1-(5-phosphoribosyl)-5-((5-phosphoribosylamino)methylideneamino)imidazole-4-carboxamide isomerase [Gammaproteobacteria bacterium]
MTPEKIKLHTSDGSLELAYPDGSIVTFSGEFLRVHSPSAEVRGHGPGEEVLQHGKQNVKIRSLQPSGHYALLIEFDDGHNTGIYSWPYLQELHENRDQLWQAYLQKLTAASQSRDPEEKVVKFITPK